MLHRHTALQQLCITVLLIAFSACKSEPGKVDPGDDRPEVPANQTAEKPDTTWWSVDRDTVISRAEIEMQAEPYDLAIRMYCLNDSAIMKPVYTESESGQGLKEDIDISHNYEGEIRLTKDDREIFAKRISRETFRDSLDPEFYRQATLKNIEYEAVRSNRLYFTAYLHVPDTDWLYRASFRIFYKTDKVGQIDYYGVKESQ